MPPDDLIAALMFVRGHDSALRALLDRIDPSELEAVASELETEGASVAAAWLRECAQLAREVAGAGAPARGQVRASHVREVLAGPEDDGEDDVPTVVEGLRRRG